MRFVLWLAIAVAGCSRSPSTPRGGSSATSPSASVSASAPGGSLSATPVVPLPDGCWMEVDRDAEARALLAALRAACAPGTRALIEGRELALAADQPAELSLEAPAGGGCLRVIAAGPRELLDFGLELVDGSGRVLDKDGLVARFALLGERGPVCVPPGRYKLVLGARGGAGTVRLEVLVAAGDAR